DLLRRIYGNRIHEGAIRQEALCQRNGSIGGDRIRSISAQHNLPTAAGRHADASAAYARTDRLQQPLDPDFPADFPYGLHGNDAHEARGRVENRDIGRAFLLALHVENAVAHRQSFSNLAIADGHRAEWPSKGESL